MKRKLEQLAELLVLTDPSDPRSLADIHGRFEEIAQWAEGESCAEVADASKASAELIEKVILEEVSDPAASMAVLGKAVEALQRVICDGWNPKEAAFPKELLPDSSSLALDQEPEITIQTGADDSPDGYKDLLGGFVVEANEHLEAAEIHLLALETNPNDEEALNAVFRAFHTIKGVAGFLALADVGTLAHEAESMLDRARKGDLALCGAEMDVAFDAVDTLKGLVEAVKRSLETGKPLSADSSVAPLVERIKAVVLGELSEEPPPTPGAEGAKLGEILVESGETTQEDVDRALAKQRAQDPDQRQMLGELLVRDAQVPAREVAKALRAQGALRSRLREPVRVDSERLDRLLDAVGELVIAESMVAQSEEFPCSATSELTKHLGQLDKITRELEELGTSLRMVPIRSTFQKMARLARDLSRKAGKLIEFVSSGEETELDKSMAEKISDPLVHLVRNAVDHGIEDSPEERLAAGKPEIGRIELRAFHKGDSIYIRIEDDGRGLDRKAILAKAIERGLVREGESLTDDEVHSLVLQPGFSTAKKVTDVSGRGVGLDVVRKNVESLRGQIDIRSEQGKGTVLTLRLPLTLAIIDGMVVRVAAEEYIIPTPSIVRTIRPESDQLAPVMSQREVLSLPDGLVPLARLNRLIGIPGGEENPARGLAVVVEDEGERLGLLVDDLVGQQQAVIKPLGRCLRGVPGVSGGAVMPDGRVGLVLDVGGLIRLARSEALQAVGSAEQRKRSFVTEPAEARNERGGDEMRAEMGDRSGKYLTFTLGSEEYGIAILGVREIIRSTHITPVPGAPEVISGVINLRGRVIPVVDLRARLGMERTDQADRTCIIVTDLPADGDSSLMGILVDDVNEVIDIAEEEIEDTPSFGDGFDSGLLVGIARNKGRVKMLLEIDEVLNIGEVRMPPIPDQPEGEV